MRRLLSRYVRPHRRPNELDRGKKQNNSHDRIIGTRREIDRTADQGEGKSEHAKGVKCAPGEAPRSPELECANCRDEYVEG